MQLRLVPAINDSSMTNSESTTENGKSLLNGNDHANGHTTGGKRVPSSTGFGRVKAVPRYPLHYVPFVYLSIFVAVYCWIQSSAAEELHNYLVTRFGGYVAIIGFGTVLFAVFWHSYGLLQAFMDANPQVTLWSQFKSARLDSLTYRDIIPNVLFNQFVVATPVTIALYVFSQSVLGGRGYGGSANTFVRLSLPELALQILANYVVYDAAFYLSHRLLHSKALYKYHKLHHLTYGTVGVSGSYMSPLDFILTQVL